MILLNWKYNNQTFHFKILRDMNADQNKAMTLDDPILKFTQEKVDFLRSLLQNDHFKDLNSVEMWEQL